MSGHSLSGKPRVGKNREVPILKMPPILIPPSDLAALVGLSIRTIYNRINTQGDLPPIVRMGRLPRFALDDVHAWINTKRSAANDFTPHRNNPFATTRRRPGRPTKAEQIARRGRV